MAKSPRRPGKPLSRKIRHTETRPSNLFTAGLILSLIASASLVAVALSSPAHAWMAWVSLVPLFVAIRILAPEVALFAGALWGSYLYALLALVHPTVVPLGLRSLALMIFLPGMYAYLGARLTRRIGYDPLLLALGWMGLEFALHPIIQRQSLLALSQAQSGPVQVVEGLFGYAFVALLVVWVNAMLVAVLGRVRFVKPGLRALGSSPAAEMVIEQICFLPSFLIASAAPRAPPLSLRIIRIGARDSVAA